MIGIFAGRFQARRTVLPRPVRRGPDKAAASSRDIRPTGQWVVRLRRRSGLSVARFAALLGVSAVTVYRWEATPGLLNLHARPLNALMAFHRQAGKSASRR